MLNCWCITWQVKFKILIYWHPRLKKFQVKKCILKKVKIIEIRTWLNWEPEFSLLGWVPMEKRLAEEYFWATERPFSCHCVADSISARLPCVIQIHNWPHVHVILSRAKLHFRLAIRFLTFAVIRWISMLFLVSVRRVMSCADKLVRVVVIWVRFDVLKHTFEPENSKRNNTVRIPPSYSTAVCHQDFPFLQLFRLVTVCVCRF